MTEAGRAAIAVVPERRPVYAVLTAVAVARRAFVVLGGLAVFASNANHLTPSKAGHFVGMAVGGWGLRHRDAGSK